MPWKHVLHGCRVDFHLIVRADAIADWTSTVQYTLSEAGAHGSHCREYLANLQLAKANRTHIYWNPRFGDPHIRQWRIAVVPDCNGCHTVEVTTDQNMEEWHVVDCAYHSTPN
jgi:hypothetical protein